MRQEANVHLRARRSRVLEHVGQRLLHDAIRRQVDAVREWYVTTALDGEVDGDAGVANARDPVKVLVLTTFDLDEYVYEALRAGASGFLLKDVPRDELARGIRVIAGGEALLAPSVTRRLVEDFARRPLQADRSARLDVLTGREREVLELVARGLSNTEIAEALYVSGATVKTHFGHVLMKLDLRDRVQAVILAYDVGLVAPGG